MRPLVLALGLFAATTAGAQQAQKPQAPVYSVVEPKAPATAKPAARQRAAKANAQAPAPKAPILADAEPLKPNGPCVIKPVMSDQDLINCGARLHH